MEGQPIDVGGLVTAAALSLKSIGVDVMVVGDRRRDKMVF